MNKFTFLRVFAGVLTMLALVGCGNNIDDILSSDNLDIGEMKGGVWFASEKINNENIFGRDGNDPKSNDTTRPSKKDLGEFDKNIGPVQLQRIGTEKYEIQINSNVELRLKAMQNGAGVAGVKVAYKVVRGTSPHNNGSVSPVKVVTDATGVAKVFFNAGTAKAKYYVNAYSPNDKEGFVTYEIQVVKPSNACIPGSDKPVNKEPLCDKSLQKGDDAKEVDFSNPDKAKEELGEPFIKGLGEAVKEGTVEMSPEGKTRERMSVRTSKVFSVKVLKDNAPFEGTVVGWKLVKGASQANNAMLENPEAKEEKDKNTLTVMTKVDANGIASVKFNANTGYDSKYYLYAFNASVLSPETLIPVKFEITTFQGPDLTLNEGNEPVSNDVTPPLGMPDPNPSLGELRLISDIPTDIAVDPIKTIYLSLRLSDLKDKPATNENIYWSVVRGDAPENNASASKSPVKTDANGRIRIQFFTGTGIGSLYYVNFFHPNVPKPLTYTIKVRKIGQGQSVPDKKPSDIIDSNDLSDKDKGDDFEIMIFNEKSQNFVEYDKDSAQKAIFLPLDTRHIIRLKLVPKGALKAEKQFVYYALDKHEGETSEVGETPGFLSSQMTKTDKDGITQIAFNTGMLDKATYRVRIASPKVNNGKDSVTLLFKTVYIDELNGFPRGERFNLNVTGIAAGRLKEVMNIETETLKDKLNIAKVEMYLVANEALKQLDFAEVTKQSDEQKLKELSDMKAESKELKCGKSPKNKEKCRVLHEKIDALEAFAKLVQNASEESIEVIFGSEGGTAQLTTFTSAQIGRSYVIYGIAKDTAGAVKSIASLADVRYKPSSEDIEKALDEEKNKGPKDNQLDIEKIKDPTKAEEGLDHNSKTMTQLVEFMPPPLGVVSGRYEIRLLLNTGTMIAKVPGLREHIDKINKTFGKYLNNPGGELRTHIMNCLTKIPDCDQNKCFRLVFGSEQSYSKCTNLVEKVNKIRNSMGGWLDKLINMALDFGASELNKVLNIEDRLCTLLTGLQYITLYGEIELKPNNDGTFRGLMNFNGIGVPEFNAKDPLQIKVPSKDDAKIRLTGANVITGYFKKASITNGYDELGISEFDINLVYGELVNYFLTHHILPPMFGSKDPVSISDMAGKLIGCGKGPLKILGFTIPELAMQTLCGIVKTKIDSEIGSLTKRYFLNLRLKMNGTGILRPANENDGQHAFKKAAYIEDGFLSGETLLPTGKGKREKVAVSAMWVAALDGFDIPAKYIMDEEFAKANAVKEKIGQDNICRALLKDNDDPPGGDEPTQETEEKLKTNTQCDRAFKTCVKAKGDQYCMTTLCGDKEPKCDKPAQGIFYCEVLTMKKDSADGKALNDNERLYSLTDGTSFGQIPNKDKKITALTAAIYKARAKCLTHAYENTEVPEYCGKGETDAEYGPINKEIALLQEDVLIGLSNVDCILPFLAGEKTAKNSCDTNICKKHCFIGVCKSDIGNDYEKDFVAKMLEKNIEMCRNKLVDLNLPKDCWAGTKDGPKDISNDADEKKHIQAVKDFCDNSTEQAKLCSKADPADSDNICSAGVKN